jgi:serine phosphatase RsbU (regulator of sigma subunit)
VSTENDLKLQQQLREELQNFEEIADHLKPSPGETPKLSGVDIAGLSIPFSHSMGGDHIIYVDFNRRYDLDLRIERARSRGRDSVAENLERLKSRAGILLVDVSGHRVTDGLIAAMLHQAFLLGAYYELDRYGHITTRIFEHINTRFYRTTSVNKYFTMIYGEISDEGHFRFISAGHHPPAIFSREFGRVMHISQDRLVSFPPVGLLPSSSDPDEPVESGARGYKKKYEVNDLDLLNHGDILLLFSDGLVEHADSSFYPQKVEKLLVECSNCTAAETLTRIQKGIEESGEREDDISVIAIRRTL